MQMRSPQWRWRGNLCNLWRALDHEGEVLEAAVTVISAGRTSGQSGDPPQTDGLVAEVLPRSASESSTVCFDSGYLAHIIKTSGITSGELLKYRNGLVIAAS
jgi:hypothetical protein